MKRMTRPRAAPRRKQRTTAARPRREAKPRRSFVEVQEIESLRGELDRLAASSGPPRWNANPNDVQRSVVKLVLTLVEFLRQVLERQAIRRMDEQTVTEDQVEAIGTALMRLEETIRDLAAQFDLTPEDLKLDLGPVGKLL